MLKISQAVLASILIVFFADLFMIMNRQKTKRFTIIASIATFSMLIGMFTAAVMFTYLSPEQKTLLMAAVVGSSLVLLEALDKDNFNIFFIIGATTTLLCLGIIILS